jgi:hypothetical protein
MLTANSPVPMLQPAKEKATAWLVTQRANAAQKLPTSESAALRHHVNAPPALPQDLAPHGQLATWCASSALRVTSLLRVTPGVPLAGVTILTMLQGPAAA